MKLVELLAETPNGAGTQTVLVNPDAIAYIEWLPNSDGSRAVIHLQGGPLEVDRATADFFYENYLVHP